MVQVPPPSTTTISVSLVSNEKVALRRIATETEIMYLSLDEAERVRRGIEGVLRERPVDPNNFEFTLGTHTWLVKNGELTINGEIAGDDEEDAMLALARAYIGAPNAA